MNTKVRVIGLSLLLGGLATAPATLEAQWTQVAEQFYLPAQHNWAFRRGYPGADRLFNAFDYGHAILYEKLYTQPQSPITVLEDREYDFITRKLLVNPPHVPVEEAAIEVEYAKLVPEAKAMFEWAHLLHRQVYDVWADERIPMEEKDAKVAELIRYYRSRSDLAFSSLPKNMDLMEGQPYSLAFRRKYPKFNGLIWAYHWLQVGLYEPLVTGRTFDERQAGVLAAVARFKQMLEDPPHTMPYLMPMTAAVAPTFAARYPEAAIIFDNLHSMHDVISDILVSPGVARNQKRSEIIKAAARYRDDTSFVMTEKEWREMSLMMGVNNMGGAAVGFLSSLPKPTVPLGVSHQAAAGGMEGMDHGAMQMPGDTTAQQVGDTVGGHDAHRPAVTGDSTVGNVPPAASQDSLVLELLNLQEKLLADPAIRRRIRADTALRAMVERAASRMSPDQRERVERLLRRASPPARTSPPAQPARPEPTRPAADPHAGHQMPRDTTKIPPRP